jgi:hypothetical protein
MWCPQCKTEYRVGFTHCSDCGSPLVNLIAVEPPLPQDDTQLIVLRTFPTEFDANLAKGALEAAGIDSMVQGARPRTSDFERLAGGISLVIRAEDAEEAENILKDLPK